MDAAAGAAPEERDKWSSGSEPVTFNVWHSGGPSRVPSWPHTGPPLYSAFCLVWQGYRTECLVHRTRTNGLSDTCVSGSARERSLGSWKSKQSRSFPGSADMLYPLSQHVLCDGVRVLWQLFVGERLARLTCSISKCCAIVCAY